MINIIKKRLIVLLLILLSMIIFNRVYPVQNFEALDSIGSMIVGYSNGENVVVESTNSLGSRSLGSGFYIASTIVVTCEHVVVNDNCKVNGIESTIIAKDSEKDIALIRVKINKTPLKIAAKQPVQGEKVRFIGSPKGLGNSMGFGIVANPYRVLSGAKYPFIQLSADVNSGNSGGALLNENGELLGVVSRTLKDSQGIGFAIPIWVVQDLLKSIQ